ncbi:MAG: PilW family protein [Candidatus Sericytochromatia bacterium]
MVRSRSASRPTATIPPPRAPTNRTTMPSPSSRSTSRASRPGFTLLELLIATALMTLVFAVMMQAFLGARKAQGMTVAIENLKHEGQQAMHHMMLELGQARRLIASQATDPAEVDMGRDFFEAIDDLKGVSPPLPATLRHFVRIDSNGSFGKVGNGETEMPYSAFGNALIFVKRETELPIVGETIKFGSTLSDRTLTEQQPYRLYVYRFIAYYLAMRPLPHNAPPINGDWTSGLTLYRFESQPYHERSEVWGFLKRLPDADERTRVWNDKLAATTEGEAIAGAWDANEPDPNLAFFTYSKDEDEMINQPGYVRGKQSRPLTQFMSEPYAIGTVAFNAGSKYPNFQVAGNRDGAPSFVGPAFALDPDAASPTQVPYGFEVGVIGANSGRQVLLRLALAARITAGNHLYGHTHQQIVQVFDN